MPNALSSRVDGANAVVAAASWDAGQSADLAARLDADLEVESLGLEEIFLEMHRRPSWRYGRQDGSDFPSGFSGRAQSARIGGRRRS
ncbi:MAG TPA: hypothetical protein VFV10_09305 [Gammaproteobacteria bacterium]|nr:hypothetical protein [Gammaproteobacteria bacterium]